MGKKLTPVDSMDRSNINLTDAERRALAKLLCSLLAGEKVTGRVEFECDLSQGAVSDLLLVERRKAQN